MRLLLVAACYYLGARLGLLQALVNDQVTPLWPPTGVALLALLLGGLRMWPGITVAAFAVNASLSDVGATAVISLGNTAGPVVSFLLLRRVGFRSELDRTRDALALVLLGAFAGMLVSATVGGGALLVSGVIGGGDFLSTWSVWWTGDVLGVLVVVPLVLAARSLRGRRPAPRRLAEAVALLGGTAVVMAVATTVDIRLMYLVFPFLVWAAFRFQHAGTAPCALIATTLAARGAALSDGPFEGLDLLVRMVTLQAFNGTTVTTALLVSAAIAERNAARSAIERTVDQLADVVSKYQPLLARNVLPPRPPEGS
ncbi:MASE1 domain-containing protein [Saccharothrix syringae]|uniref:MASE1 domain-containing protein n=1 Tax=Saccharothrix syringae TaxID=103733 RepID=UPI000B2B10F3|nr:MASE1 domain-containing protein [Saccharothrix syringae]